jgi:hypothetical protein
MSADLPIIHPEIVKLLELNGDLRGDIARMLAEEYELKNTVAPNLRALYQVKFGDLEIALLRKQFEVAKLRRMLELAQSALNQGKAPNWKEIREQIKLEEVLWQAKLMEALKTFSEAAERLKALMSEADAEEFRKLYRALVKKLHPDLNPNPSERQKELWLSVQTAYQAGDLAALRLYASIAETLEELISLHAPNALDSLRAAQADLLHKVNGLTTRLKRLKATEPFTLAAILENSSLVAAKRATLQAEIDTATGQENLLHTLLQPLLATEHGTIFGPN